MFLLFQVIRDVHIEPVHIMKKRSIDHPLRILLYYDESVYRYVRKSSLFSYSKKLFSNALENHRLTK